MTNTLGLFRMFILDTTKEPWISLIQLFLNLAKKQQQNRFLISLFCEKHKINDERI